MAKPTTRRTTETRVNGRAAVVVERVLQATAEELSVVGFAALRIEDVASRSGVNKTTIYRRWPTRAELVAATIRKLKPSWHTPRAETLREEVLLVARDAIALHASPEGRGLLRVIQTEVGHPELEPVIKELRAESRRGRAAIVERAIARGELPAGVDAWLVADMIFAPFLNRLITFCEPIDEMAVEHILDVVVAGLRATSAPAGHRRSTKAASARK